MVDKAVEERIRTDQEFGEGHYGFWDWSWWYPPESVDGITFRDLDGRDLSKPLPCGMDLVAEMLLQGHSYYSVGLPEIEGNNYGYETRALFSEKMRTELEPLRKALLNEDVIGWKFATNNDEVASVLRKAGLDYPGSVVDPWGTPYHCNFGIAVRLQSASVCGVLRSGRFAAAMYQQSKVRGLDDSQYGSLIRSVRAVSEILI